MTSIIAGFIYGVCQFHVPLSYAKKVQRYIYNEENRISKPCLVNPIKDENISVAGVIATIEQPSGKVLTFGQ